MVLINNSLELQWVTIMSYKDNYKFRFYVGTISLNGPLFYLTEGTRRILNFT